MLRRVKIEPDDVLQLLGKVRIIGDFECAAQMGLEPMLAPNAADGRSTQIGRAGHQSAAPVRCRLGLLAGRPAHHHRDDLWWVSRLAPPAWRILLKAGPALSNKATAPPGGLLLRDPQAHPDFTIGLPIGSHQDNERALRESHHLDPAAADLLQPRSVVFAQFNSRGGSHSPIMHTHECLSLLFHNICGALH